MIRDALQKKDTAGTLLREHLLAYPEMLDSIRKTENLASLDWASLMHLDPKRVHNKKLLAKKWLTENA